MNTSGLLEMNLRNSYNLKSRVVGGVDGRPRA